MDAAGQHDLTAAGHRVSHQRGLGQRRRAVVDGRVGHVHSRQLRDHRLVLVDRAERALARLRLIGRVGREELAAADQVIDWARHVVIIGAGAEEADVAVAVSVGGGQRAHVADQLGLGQRGR